MKKQSKKIAISAIKLKNAPAKEKKVDKWVMSVKSVEKNGCLINFN